MKGSFIGLCTILSLAPFAGFSAESSAIPSPVVPTQAPPAVALPPFIVSEQPNWLYLPGPGFEILSLCDATATLELAQTQLRLARLLDVVLPKPLRVQRDAPLLVVAYTKSPKQSLSKNAVLEKLRNSGKDQPRLRPEISSEQPIPNYAEYWGKKTIPVEVQFVPNLLLRDSDQIVVLALLPDEGFNHATLTVAPGYFNLLAWERTPPLPQWFLLGLRELGPKISFPQTPYEKIVIGPATWVVTQWKADSVTEREFRILTWKNNADPKLPKISLAERYYTEITPPSKWIVSEWVPAEFTPELKTRLFSLDELTAIKDPLAFDDREMRRVRGRVDPISVNELFPPPLVPFTEFFNRAPPNDVEALQLWRCQASLLIRWMLDPEAHAAPAKFTTFVDMAGRERVTDALFKECFGLTLAEGEKALANYVRKALRESLQLNPPPSDPAALALPRKASQVEIARIKGELERLEAAHVRQEYPEFATTYLAQSLRTFQRAENEPDARNVRLLAAAGLSEVEAGHSDRARELLEAAVQGNVVRPQAYVELARLRLTDARTHPLGSGEMLNPAQVEGVLSLLRRAREQAPPLADVYKLTAETWSESDSPPSRQQLNVLEEGVRLFPTHTALIFATASVYAQYGLANEASALAELGLVVARNDNPVRPRLEALRARLNSARLP